MNLIRLTVTLATVFLSQCVNIGDPGMGSGTARLSIYFNDPGVDEFTMTDKQIDRELTDLMDNAQTSVYLAVFNFNKQSIIDAILRANLRNLDVKVVGDIDEFYTHGYQSMQHQNIDMILGNSSGIQHNKFAIVDNRYVFMGTGNLSSTDMIHNNNNWYIIENEDMARLYTEEFMQMYNGQFAARKRPRSSDYDVTVNNNRVEVFFSPYHGQRAMNRLIDLVNDAQRSIDYMIFAYTHDELAAAMVKAARQRNIPVRGTHDSTFINGVSQEAPRLFAAGYSNNYQQVGEETRHEFGPFPRVDGNENTKIRNNPAHGGKMHAKTIIVDVGTPNAKIATGSFNWSNNAIVNNDENMVIFHDPSIANAIYQQFQETWAVARDLSFRLRKNGHTANPGDIVISEVHWAGASRGSSVVAKDDFVEIYNNSAGPIDISHWGFQWGRNENYNIYPVADSSNEYYENRQACAGFTNYNSPLPNIICPGQHRIFYALPTASFAEPSVDEILVYDQDGSIIRSNDAGSLTTRHFRISGVKNFNLTNAEFKVRLFDKSMRLIDEAGDGGNPFGGSHEFDNDGNNIVRSMVRRNYTEDNNRRAGNLRSAWGTTGNTAISCTSTNNLEFDACFDAQTHSFVSPGYGNTAALDPVVSQIVLTSNNQAEIQFNDVMSNCNVANTNITATGNVASISTGTNSALGKLTVSLTTGFTAPATNYTLTLAASCQNAGGQSIAGDPVNFTLSGYSANQANVKLEKVVMGTNVVHDIFSSAPSAERRRFVRFGARSSGSIRNLRVIRYSADGIEELYRFSDLYLTAGDSVVVSFTKPSRDTSAGKTTAQRMASNHDLFSPGTPDTDNGIIARPAPNGSALFNVYSLSTSLAGTDDTILLTYCGLGPDSGCTEDNYGVQDVVYYTSRNGNVNSSLMEGALTHIYTHLRSFWPVTEAPIAALNDVTIQRTGVCTNNTPDGTGDCTCGSTSNGIQRVSEGTGKSAWQCL